MAMATGLASKMRVKSVSGAGGFDGMAMNVALAMMIHAMMVSNRPSFLIQRAAMVRAGL